MVLAVMFAYELSLVSLVLVLPSLFGISSVDLLESFHHRVWSWEERVSIVLASKLTSPVHYHLVVLPSQGLVHTCIKEQGCY
jgi:hypothetical protein